MKIARKDEFQVLQQNEQFLEDIIVTDVTNRHVTYIFADVPRDKQIVPERVTRLHFERAVMDGIIGKRMDPPARMNIQDENPADELTISQLRDRLRAIAR